MTLLQPWGKVGKAAAIDSTALRAKGGVWHKKDREQGVVPHSTIDTDAHWSKSGYHGWWYGWKLHLVCTAASLWIPLAAALTAANVADQDEAPALLRELDLAIRYVLGDTHYNVPEVRRPCEAAGRYLIATQPGASPRTDPGAPVRQLFHQLRSKNIEPFNARSAPTKLLLLASWRRLAFQTYLRLQAAAMYRAARQTVTCGITGIVL